MCRLFFLSCLSFHGQKCCYIGFFSPHEVVDCGNLQNPRFGRVVLTGTTFGSTATYSCQRGYILVGGSTRTCQANGQWSGQAPVCNSKLLLAISQFVTAWLMKQSTFLFIYIVVSCGDLPNPRFGRVVLTGTTFGSTATYSCQGGYILVGGLTRTCQANGQWSGQAPVCNSKVLFVIQF